MQRLMISLALMFALCLSLPSLSGVHAQDKKDAKDKKPVNKVEANGVDYLLTNAKVNNQKLELSFSVVCAETATMLTVSSASAYTDDGKVYMAKFRSFSKEAIRAKLPIGQKVQVKVNLGNVPDGVTSLSTIELQVQGGKKKGTYNIVFKNIPVER